MSNFTKAGSEDWQSTLTRAPLFANLFLDRLAALGSRVVNAPLRGLCFVALFDQVVDCRLLAYVPPVDTPWRCSGHSHSPRPVAAFSQSAEAAAVPVSAGCLSASVFRADLPLLNSVYPCR